MKICFIGNMDSSHMVKWVDYFANVGGATFVCHVTGLWNGLQQLKRIKTLFPFDILHAHYAGLCGLIGALINYHPFVVTVWGSDVLINIKSWIKRPFIKWILKKADLITCDAEYVKEFMISKLDVPGEKIKIIRHGVDVEKFKPDGWKCSEPMVISLRSYDMETLEKTMKIVRRDFPTCYFREPSAYGYIRSEDVPKHLDSAWIYVDTSPIDAGLSMATAEAMACGLPVVITDIGENKDWVDPYFCIPPGRPDILAGRIIELLNDPVQRQAQGERNREQIVFWNDYHQEMAKMETLYEEIVND